MKQRRHRQARVRDGGLTLDVIQADEVAVRNSNRPEAGTLVFTRAEMAAWIAGCKAGEFDDLA